jgi:elongation factor 1-beta
MSAAFDTKNAGNHAEVEKFLSQHAYLSGKNLPGKEDAEVLKQIKEVPCHTKTPAIFAWWWALVSFDESVKATWGAEAKKAEPKKEEKKPEPKKDEVDELDFFGEENEEEKAAMEELKKQQEAKKKEAAAKKVIIAKSRVVFEVKGYEEKQDFNELGHRIMKEINRDGLVWQDSFKIVPYVYGTFKLQMTMIVEDEKVSADDIMEEIKDKWEDEVQNCDIVEFNKA